MQTAPSKRFTGLGDSYLKTEVQPASEMACFFKGTKNSRRWTRFEKNENVTVSYTPSSKPYTVDVVTTGFKCSSIVNAVKLKTNWSARRLCCIIRFKKSYYIFQRCTTTTSDPDLNGSNVLMLFISVVLSSIRIKPTHNPSNTTD
jgi:hypothetical protein